MFNDKKVLTNIKGGIIFDLSINIKYLMKGNFKEFLRRGIFKMKENAINKINKVGHIGLILSKIVRGFLIAGFVGTIIGEIALCAMPSELFSVTVGGIVEGTVSKKGIVKLTGNNTTEEEITAEVEKGALMIANGSFDIDDEEYAINEFRNEGNNIAFSGAAKSPKTISVVTIRWTVALAALMIVISFVLFMYIGKLCKALEECESPFSETVIKSLNTFSYVLLGYVVVGGVTGAAVGGLVAGSGSFNINLSTVLVALAVYVLTVIFKYGAILQQESDETL